MRAELLALALLVPGVARAQTAAPDAREGFTLADALRAARQNPSLAAPRSLARAAEADVGAMSRWSNPQLGVSYMRSFGYTTFDPDLGVPQVGVTQLIETAGLPGRRRRAAAAERDAARLEVRRAARSVALSVTTSFVRLAVARQRVAILREATQRTQDLAALVTARVAAGTAPGYERTRAALAVRASQTALGDADADADEARVALDLAVGPSSATLRGEPRVDLADAPPLPSLAEAALASLPGTRVELLVTQARAQAAQARVDVARGEVLPGFQLYGGLLAGQGYGEQGQRQVDFMVGVTVPLPLINNGHDAVRAAEARAVAAREQSEAERFEARLRVEGAWRVAQRRRDNAAEVLRGREDHERLLARDGGGVSRRPGPGAGVDRRRRRRARPAPAGRRGARCRAGGRGVAVGGPGRAAGVHGVDGRVGVEIVIVLLLTLLNGVFSAAEIAVLSVRKTRLAELVAEGSRGARATQWLREQPERFLATVQIGITVLSTTAAAFGGDSLADDLAAWMAPRAPWLGGGAHRLALVLVISLLSYLSIVLGELVPKSLALRNAERLALLLSPLLQGISSVARPLVWLFTASSNALLRLFGDHTSFVEARLSAEELQELVEEAGRTGSLDPGASEIASRAIDFRELTAFDVMVPRESIVSVSRAADLRRSSRTCSRRRRFARLPVYAELPRQHRRATSR